MSSLPYHKGNKTNFINLLFTLTPDLVLPRRPGETVRKVKHSSVRIENPIPALYMGTEYFSLARTFRTTWGAVEHGALNMLKIEKSHPKGLMMSDFSCIFAMSLTQIYFIFATLI